MHEIENDKRINSLKMNNSQAQTKIVEDQLENDIQAMRQQV